jgi:cytochrome c-type biogenesis protein CcmE
MENFGMSRSRIKIFVASSILVSSLILLVFVGVKNTSLRHFRPEQLIAQAQEVHQKGVQIDGFIVEKSTSWDHSNFQLSFVVRDEADTARVNVVSVGKLKPDNFKGGGNVFVEGRYNADENLITASKIQTKCASKYQQAGSALATQKKYQIEAEVTRQN